MRRLRGNTLDDGLNIYAYDALNRQTEVTNTAAITAEYVYDARGRRVAKIVDGTRTELVYDVEYRVLEERDGDGSLAAHYTYGAGMDEPLTMEQGGQTYHYHRDALGSITEVSDGSGQIVERYEYDAYGEVTIYIYDNGEWIAQIDSAIGNRYLFTGREYDPESGNYYYRARIYSPALGRFLGMDPLGFEAGDYNLYRYAFNNPTTLTDPTGEFAFIPWLLKAGAEAAADAFMQALFNYYFDPTITTVEEALRSIDFGRTAWTFALALVPGSRWVKELTAAGGDVLLYILDAEKECRELTLEEILKYFAFSLGSQVIGDYIGDAVAKYGTRAVAKGLRELGLDELAEKLMHHADDVVDDMPCSFSSDTPVTTPDGLEAIGALDVGEYVLAFDEETGKLAFYPIIAIWVHQDPVVVYLGIEGEVIETTPEHPFYTAEGEWAPAGELKAGDQVRRADGSFGVVRAVVLVAAPQAMYNLTVANAHTFFVGQGQWFVHNQCLRGKAAADAAAKLGYTNRVPPQKLPFDSHGQPGFYNSRTKTYITPDVGHSGQNPNPRGVWKMFNRNGKRIGTYDADLHRVGD